MTNRILPIIFAVLNCILLNACASQPQYTPDLGSYQAWRACRVSYEQEHNPANPYSFDTTSLLLGGAASNMIGDTKLAGPDMDMAINNCMKEKGYSRSSN